MVSTSVSITSVWQYDPFFDFDISRTISMTESQLSEDCLSFWVLLQGFIFKERNCELKNQTTQRSFMSVLERIRSLSRVISKESILHRVSQSRVYLPNISSSPREKCQDFFVQGLLKKKTKSNCPKWNTSFQAAVMAPKRLSQATVMVTSVVSTPAAWKSRPK